MHASIFLHDTPGSIFSLNVAGTPVIVVNDFTTAADLVGLSTLSDIRDVFRLPCQRSSVYNLQQSAMVHYELRDPYWRLVLWASSVR